jgi:hypothetical protein
MRERWNSLPADARLALRLLAIATVILILAFGSLRLYQSRLPAPRRVSMDGGDVLGVIYLWNDYQNRKTPTGTVRSGEAVSLLQQSGAGCQVETNAGDRGWVLCADVIKEFK